MNDQYEVEQKRKCEKDGEGPPLFIIMKVVTTMCPPPSDKIESNDSECPDSAYFDRV